MLLADRVAIITGGGVGIGKAFCLGMAAQGAKVVAADINLEAAQVTAREIVQSGADAIAVKVDVTSEAATQEMARKAADHFGRIDILVNNAALFSALGPGKPWYQLDLDEWDRVMAVNLKGLFLCCRAVYPYMRDRGWGRIINISSATAIKGNTNRLHYVTSKAGVLGFTRAMAREMAGQNINVNSIAVGSTLSEGLIARGDMTTPEALKAVKASRCVQKEMYPKDIVGTAVFLASEMSEFVCGETIVVDGGVVFN